MVYVLLGEGFEEIEALTPVDVLRRCGAEVCTAGIGGRQIIGAHGIPVTADCTVDEIDRDGLSMIVVPGGMGGVTAIGGSDAAMAAIEWAWKNGKYVASICAGPTVLSKLGITRGRRCTSYPGMGDQIDCAAYVETDEVVIDGKLITSRGPGTAGAFALALARVLCGAEAADKVKTGMLME